MKKPAKDIKPTKENVKFEFTNSENPIESHSEEFFQKTKVAENTSDIVYSDYWLVVRTPFQTYKKGDLIQDPVKVEEILNSNYKFNVVKIFAKYPYITED